MCETMQISNQLILLDKAIASLKDTLLNGIFNMFCNDKQLEIAWWM